VEAPRPRRSLGQNFLRARWVSRLFADWACRYRRLLEIGPGLGALTREVLARCPLSELYLVELDNRLLAGLLTYRLLAPMPEVVHADALSLPLRLEALEAVYGSIPYNITGPLLAALSLTDRPLPAMLLLQREVAQRLAARPGSKSYGRISVLVQLAYSVRLGPVVPPSAFQPRPRVYSQIVYLEPQEEAPPAWLRRRVEELTRCMFSQRNRLAYKVAARCVGLQGVAAEELRLRRVYELSPSDFLRLAENTGGDEK